MEKSCDFCNELKNNQEILEDCRKKRPSLKNYKTKYKVALIVEQYDLIDNPDVLTGVMVGRHLSMNFCPVCGRKISESELSK
jgi:ABC-type phosphate/phosphonate transport system ATPase subunit